MTRLIPVNAALLFSKPYIIAMAVSMAEYLLESLLLPGIKLQVGATWHIMTWLISYYMEQAMSSVALCFQ